MEKTYTLNIGGTDLVFKTGKIAKQAGAAIVASHGETTVLTTVCMSDKPRAGLDFFPLLVAPESRVTAVLPVRAISMILKSLIRVRKCSIFCGEPEMAMHNSSLLTFGM